MRPLIVPIGVSSSSAISLWRVAAVERELDHAALLVGQLVERGADLARLVAARDLDVGALGGLEALLDPLVARRGDGRGRRCAAAQSIERLWTIPSTHVRTLPRVRS